MSRYLRYISFLYYLCPIIYKCEGLLTESGISSALSCRSPSPRLALSTYVPFFFFCLFYALVSVGRAVNRFATLIPTQTS
ncbi:hypothetical protein F4810DRAFT_145177 [Camillea tinctor]|nr:hypothetical protein F4810DRAFT_145177 [Camillea tinctor]